MVDDVCKLITLGTGSVVPTKTRFGISNLVLLGEDSLLFDCGPGACSQMAKAGMEARDLSAVFLTHLHLDHVLELPLVIFWAFWNGRKEPVKILGPKGIKNHVAKIFQEQYSYVPDLMKARGKAFEVVVEEIEEGICYSSENFKVRSFKVLHGEIASLGFRVDSKNGSVGISGDTAPSENLVKELKGVDILLHECAFPDSFGEFPTHTIPKQLGVIASDVGAKKLLLNHFFPICEGELESMRSRIAEDYSGEVVLCNDLDEFTIQTLV